MAVHPYTRLFILASAPGVNTDITEGYEVGDVIHVTSGDIYDCRDNTDGAAIWEVRGTAGSSIFQRNLTANLSLADGECLVVSGYVNPNGHTITVNGDARLEVL